MSKRYYWLKLKNDFFDQKEIKMLRRLAGGDTYTVIYLKMLLISLENEGKIYFDSVADNMIEEIALDIDEDVENVQVAFSYLKNKGLIIEGTDEDVEMMKIGEMIGSESASAMRVRKHRRKKALQSNNCVTDVKRLGNTEKEIEKEIDIEIEKELDTEREEKSRPPVADNAFSFYEKNGFGTLAPLIIEKMDDWINDFKDKGTSEREANRIIKQALSIAVERNKRHWNYVNGILKSWFKDGLYSIDAIEAKENQWKKDVEHKQKEREGGYGGLEF